MIKRILTASLISTGMLLLLGQLAQAQVQGDEKCSADGYILTYDRALTHRWVKGSRKCKSQGQLSPATPVDGDEKCGPANVILRYDGHFNHQWDETPIACKP